MITNNEITSFLEEQTSCLNLLQNNTQEIVKIYDVLAKTRKKGKKVFTMGNGGSGSTASHFVADLLKTVLTKNNKRFSAFSLVDNIPVLLAWSNDVSYDVVFLEQLKNHLSKGDVVIGFSGSGNSKNVVDALRYARKTGAICIGFTGRSGGKMKQFCDICLQIPSNDMLTIESLHLLVCHCIADVLRKSGTPIFKYK
ncbi:SIS domain-containing protein [Nitrosopumilus sp.]|nr:SIS domain-containing protein [Nitrosopumilus sp.]